FSGSQSTRSLKHVPVRLPIVRVVRTGLAERAGISSNSRYMCVARQDDRRARLLYRKRPIIAGRVPVDLVISVKIPDLIPNSVPNDVIVLTVLNELVGVADD